MIYYIFNLFMYKSYSRIVTKIKEKKSDIFIEIKYPGFI